MQFLDTRIANKHSLEKEIYSILKIPESPDKKEHLLFNPISDLIGELIDNLTFIIEHPYVDRHYRDTYYSYYSSKFVPIDRDCLRIHLFEGNIKINDIYEKKEYNNPNDKNDPNNGKKESILKDKYYGFFIIRPLMMHMLGRSLISPKAFNERKFVCCLMRTRVSLLGNEFFVYGFPHTAQDEETHSCAESSLWCLYEYYGSKYSQYKPLLPSQIINSLQISPEHRILPSRGLNNGELAKCLNSNGFQSLVYFIYKFSEDKPFFHLINLYIESGITLLLTLISLKRENTGHAILVIGHEEEDLIYYNSDYNNQWEKHADKSWVDVSFIQKKLVFIDDNLPPYHTEELKPDKEPDETNKPNEKPILKYHDYKIQSFIVPLPVHMYITAETAYDCLEKVLDNPTIGLKNLGGKWITRLMLTGSDSFKKFIAEHDKEMDNKFKMLFLNIAMPRFVWICELYQRENFKKDSYCSGLLIIDATGDGKSLNSIILYIVNNYLFIHNGLVWDLEKTKNISPFKMKTFRNNLKGEWCKWTTN